MLLSYIIRINVINVYLTRRLNTFEFIELRKKNRNQTEGDKMDDLNGEKKTPKLNRKKEAILSRLQMGHIQNAHGYFISKRAPTDYVQPMKFELQHFLVSICIRRDS